MELEIESRNVGMTPRWKNEIESRMADLQRRHEDLIHGRVTLTKNLHHKKLANVAEALIVVTLPGRHTMTARKEDKTFEEAIRTALDAMAIELRKHREKRGAHRGAHLSDPAISRRDLQTVSKKRIRIHPQGGRRRGVLSQTRAAGSHIR